MCIIIAKSKEGRLPTEKELKNSFEWNSDGAGFMYVENGNVIIDKGFMTFKSFIGHYNKLLKKFNNFTNKSLVIHCRIGTSGKNNKSNTHPYPIANSPRLLHSRKLIVDLGIAHNGIIRGYGTPNGLNDTQEYIIKYLYPLYKTQKEFYKKEKFIRKIEKMTNSKFAILDSNEEVYLIGDFIKDDGLYFSNNTYLQYNYYNYYNYSDYNNKWYYDMYNKQENHFEEDEYMDDYDSCVIPLEKEWYVDLYGNGNPTLVGSRDYWYDLENLHLYEYIGSELKLISNNAIVYDEDGMEI